jgi:hypothetical protein
MLLLAACTGQVLAAEHNVLSLGAATSLPLLLEQVRCRLL